MSPLRTTLTESLALRRALGFQLRTAGITLRQFVHFAEQEGALCITTDLALRWAIQPQGVQPAHWAPRLGMVRHFAQYCRALDSRAEVPVTVDEGIAPPISAAEPCMRVSTSHGSSNV